MGRAKKLAAGTVISHRNDGMGARLIAALNAARIARDHDLPWHICWTTHGLTRPEMKTPTDLFSDAFVAERLSDVELMPHIQDHVTDITTLGPDLTQAAFQAMISEGKQFLSGLPMGVAALPWEDPEAIRLSLPGCLSAFEFADPVRAGMEKIDQTLAGATLTAYHIRRGDIIHHPIASNKLWPSKYIPREFYERHLSRTLEDPTARVLVFSDTAEEVARLKAVSDRVASFDDLIGRDPLTMTARDFLELYAMSRCKAIFGPPSSAFSQTAALIGGGQVEAVQDALSPADHAAAMDILTERLAAKSDLFLNHGDVGQSLHFMMAHLLEQGGAARAKRIISSYVEDGLDKGYVYRLLCELAVAAGQARDCVDIRKLAHARPAYVEDAVQVVNAYTAMAQLQARDDPGALNSLHAAVWTRPLDPVATGALNLARSLGVVTPDSYYPFDDALFRRMRYFFPSKNKTLHHLNDITDGLLGAKGDRRGYPWDICVRDWQFISGKRLGRPYTNLSKIRKAQAHVAHTYAKHAGTPQFESVMGVYARALGDLDDALEMQRRAKDAAPDKAIYRKRLSDVLYARGNAAGGLRQLRLAQQKEPAHVCYRAELAHRLLEAREKDEGLALIGGLAEQPHAFVEIHLLVSEHLRRQASTREKALGALENALGLIHGSPRLMQAHARLLIQLDRTDEAREVYQRLVAWGLDTEMTHVQIFRSFSGIGQEAVARDLTDQSSFEFDAVKAMASA